MSSQRTSDFSKRGATLVDVARAADVSVSTAGRVMRNAEYSVDTKLRDRVFAAAEHLGYVPNLIARRLRGGRQGMVGLVIGSMLDAHYGMIAEAVTERAESEHSMVAIVCNMRRDPLLEIKYCHKLLEYRVDGIILAGGGFDQWTHAPELEKVVDEIKRAGIAVASLMPRNLDVPVFAPDSEAVGLTIARHIVACGHTKVGILLGPARNEMTKLRMQAMTSHLSGHMVDFAIANIESTPDAGNRGAAAILERNPDFTALICGSDAIAYGVVAHLKSKGIAIPRGMSVIGLGNTALAELCTPRLTTIEMNFGRAGQEALDLVAGPVRAESKSTGLVIPHALVSGSSFASVSGRVTASRAPALPSHGGRRLDTIGRGGLPKR